MTIQELHEMRVDLIEALRKNNTEKGFRDNLVKRYPDKTHFIYELLQNAEDKGASVVRFILNQESLEFEHDAPKLFTIQDIDFITNIGCNDKKDDQTQIGKFGIGFKSVYEYTSSPEITSGEFRFRIRDMMIPEIIPEHTFVTNTRFIFPFVEPAKAFREITKRLQELDEGALLFLRNIRKIEYLLPDSSLGYLARSELGSHHIELTVQRPADDAEKQVRFLRFDKEVCITDETSVNQRLRIAVAFGLRPIEHDAKSNRESERQWAVEPITPGRVCIFFPALKETSNLQFHLHAPFASTPSRDSVIEELTSNEALRDEIAILLSESMTAIRNSGLLDLTFLAVLPNDNDPLSPFYRPLLARLSRQFHLESLVPLRSGGHGAANGSLFRGSAQLAELIPDEDLETLFGVSHARWIRNPPQRHQRSDAFLALLDIKSVENRDLPRLLWNNKDAMHKLFSKKPLDWHKQLYELLSESEDNLCLLKNLPIVRISDGRYLHGRECYFPTDDIEHDAYMPRVSRKVLSPGSKRFLLNIGVREVGEKEQIEALLKTKYSAPHDMPCSDAYISHLKRFVRLVQQDSSTVSLFHNTLILFCTDGVWRRPSEVYLDHPFLETGLAAYYEPLCEEYFAVGRNANDYFARCQAKELPCFTPHAQIAEKGVSIVDFAQFAEAVGARTKLEITKTSISKNPLFRSILLNYKTQKDLDYSIGSLAFLLTKPTIPFARLLWRTMNSQFRSEYGKALYQMNSHDKKPIHEDSQLIYWLTSMPWVPLNDGRFVMPCDAKSDLLPKGDGFELDLRKEWLKAIRFGVVETRQHEDAIFKDTVARKEGFADATEMRKLCELAEILRNVGKSPDELIAKLRVEQRHDFPSRSLPDLNRRSTRMQAELSEAESRDYRIKERSVRTNQTKIDTRSYLSGQYTDMNGNLYCQICQQIMPFKKRNGDFYFESVEVLSSEHLPPKETGSQYLALCPICAAKYKEFVKCVDVAQLDLKQKLLTYVGQDPTPILRIQLGDEMAELRFVRPHLADVQTILRCSCETKQGEHTASAPLE